jgi:quinol monooxygenase YgiN
MVGRLVKFTAKAEQGGELASFLLDVAESMRGTPGCLMYMINRSVEESDSVWVTELWDSQESIDAALRMLATDAGQARLRGVMNMVAAPPERIDLHPLGGIGFHG